jgi:peptidoglycan glycosyltransferase
MNKPLRRAAMFCLLLFAALMINANYIQVVKATSYSNNPANARQLLAKYDTQRGSILVGGKAVASSVLTSGQLKYLRTYSNGPEYAQATGYYSIDYGSSGIESSENGVLSGSDNRLFVSRLKELFTGKKTQGGSVVLTLNAAAQTAAYNALKANGGEGAVVALNPQTGAILALVASPTYDPNSLATHNRTTETKVANTLTSASNQPLLDRATSQTYPPGSTFKIVTATAAIESGTYNENSLIPAPDQSLPLPGTNITLPNAGGEVCGNTTMLIGFYRSCNTVFGYIGLHLKGGAATLQSQAQKFGLNNLGSNSKLTVPMPVAQSVFPTNLNQAQLAQSSIGQFDVRVTPMQDALLAAAVANNGVIMKPYLVDEELAPDDSVLSKTTPSTLSTAMSPSTAAQLKDMMTQVVQQGTGVNAQIAGVTVAGKTGTAERGAGQTPLAWFTCFAQKGNSQIALAVLVNDANAAADEVSGGSLAAPIAKQVIEAYLGSQ